MSTITLIFFLIGYLIGAIPFAVLVAKRHGINILQAGSKNPGATNVSRVVGKSAGRLVFALDFLKGTTAAFLPLYLHYSWSTALITLIAALIGHCYSCFINFKGGKGVATTMGGLAILLPLPWLLGLATFAAFFFLFRYVSLASICFGISLPISAYYLHYSQQKFLFALILAAFITFTHRSNIKRLLQGSENKFPKKKR